MPLEEHASHHRDPTQETDRVVEALGRLDQAVSAIHSSDAFRAYLDVQARYHHYSYSNALLILAQRPDATRVAGYRAWQSLGRQVRRGERGIKILVPMKVREPGGRTTTDADDTPESAVMAKDPRPNADPAGVRRRLLFGVGTCSTSARPTASHYPRSTCRSSSVPRVRPFTAG